MQRKVEAVRLSHTTNQSDIARRGRYRLIINGKDRWQCCMTDQMTGGIAGTIVWRTVMITSRSTALRANLPPLRRLD